MKLQIAYIKRLLEINGWSQNELPRRTGVSKSEISKALNNKRGVGRKLASGLLRLFPNESMDRLFILNER